MAFESVSENQFSHPEPLHILLGCTGSVASIKVPELVSLLHNKIVSVPCDDVSNCSFKLEVNVVTTKSAQHFFDVQDVKNRLGVPVFTDDDEWTLWQKRGDPVLHIELRKWADVLLLAPLDANTLAKIAQGLSDNLLTSVVRAWPFTRTSCNAIESPSLVKYNVAKPVLFAPAMNTCMFEHPLTEVHIAQLRHQFGFHYVPPVSKTLMCAETGMGAMAALESIYEAVKVACSSLKGIRGPVLPAQTTLP